MNGWKLRDLEWKNKSVNAKKKKEKRKRKKEQRVVATKILKVAKKTYNTLGAEFTSQEAGKADEYIEVKGYNNLGGNTEGNNTEYETRQNRDTRLTTPGGETPGNSSSQGADKASRSKDKESTGAAMNVLVTPPPSKSEEEDELDKMETLNEEALEQHGKSATVILHEAQPSYAGGDDAVQKSMAISSPNPAMISGTSYNSVSDSGYQMQMPEVNTKEKMIWLSMQQAEERQRKEDEERKRKAVDAEKQKYANLLSMKGPQLLEQIRDGTSRGNLRKVEPVKHEQPKDQRSQLLDSIRTTKTLKHVEKKKTVLKKSPKKKKEEFMRF